MAAVLAVLAVLGLVSVFVPFAFLTAVSIPVWRASSHENRYSGQFPHGAGRQRKPEQGLRVAFSSGSVMALRSWGSASLTSRLVLSPQIRFRLRPRDDRDDDGHVRHGRFRGGPFRARRGRHLHEGRRRRRRPRGKVEAGIPEDDRETPPHLRQRRDNVGDVAGMARTCMNRTWLGLATFAIGSAAATA